jgi:hypothetical protein
MNLFGLLTLFLEKTSYNIGGRGLKRKIMNAQWRKVIIRLSIWLMAEILLSCLGIDDLADYSEYLYERNSIVLSQ